LDGRDNGINDAGNSQDSQHNRIRAEDKKGSLVEESKNCSKKQPHLFYFYNFKNIFRYQNLPNKKSSCIRQRKKRVEIYEKQN